MSQPYIRTASPSDNKRIINFMLMAGDGIYEQLFDASFPGLTARRVLALGMRLGVGPYRYRNAFLLCNGDKVTGCIIGFPGRNLGMPIFARWALPSSRLSPLMPLFSADVKDSFYFNTLAITETERGQGFARRLLNHANGIADRAGYQNLTLHVWADNPVALALYLKWGFEIESEMAIPRTPFFRREGPLLLVRSAVKKGVA